MTSSLMIAGYASLFGQVDLAGDVVRHGAFATSLQRLPAAAIRMLYQHDPDQPIGHWIEAFEDDVGLWMRGQIRVERPQIQTVANLVQSGLADGLSIGFRTLAFEPRPSGGRILTSIDLREVSIVTFPMLPRARFRVSSPTRTGPPARRVELASPL